MRKAAAIRRMKVLNRSDVRECFVMPPIVP
jgi:hypothetical protein